MDEGHLLGSHFMKHRINIIDTKTVFFKTYFLNPKNRRNIIPKTRDKVIIILKPEDARLAGFDFLLSPEFRKLKKVCNFRLFLNISNIFNFLKCFKF